MARCLTRKVPPASHGHRYVLRATTASSSCWSCSWSSCSGARAAAWQKQKLEQEAKARQTVPGAEVLLQGGLYGTIVSYDPENLDQPAIVELAPGVEIKVHSQAILRVVDPTEAVRHRGRVPRRRGEPRRVRRRRRERRHLVDQRRPAAPRARTSRRPRRRARHEAAGLTRPSPVRASSRKLTLVATSTPVRHAWRALTGLLVITAILFGINALGVYVFKQSSWTPALALDLQGGTQIVLEAQTEDGVDADDRADGAGGHDHPPARRRLRRRRGRCDDPGRQPDRRPDPRSGRRGDPQPHRGVRAAAAARRALHGARRRTRSSARTARRRRIPTPDPTLAGDADGGADQRQRPRVDHARRCRRSSSPTTARTRPTTRRTRRPTSRSSRATPTAPSSTSSARSSSTARRSTTRPSACSRPTASGRSTSHFDDEGTKTFGEISQRLYGAEPAAQPVRVRARRLRALGALDERDHPRRRAEHHRQLHAGDLEGRSPTSSSTARCR